MKKQILLFVALLFPMSSALSENVENNGIWYLLKGQQAIVITPQGEKYSGDIAIPSSLEHNGVSYSVTAIGENAFNNCRDLHSVSIPNTVVSIGYGAFCGSEKLVSVNIPEGVTTIENFTFKDCSSLQTISIPNSVTSIGEGAFYGCSGMSSLNIGIGLIRVKTRAFGSCNITSLNILDLERWCEIMFDDYTSVPRNKKFYINGQEINHLVIPEGVTTIKDCSFGGFKGLTSVVLPNSVESIGAHAFIQCKELTSISMGNRVISIGYNAFHSCEKLSTVIIPQSVNDIGYGAFSYCIGLTSIIIPNGVTTIGTYAFSGCNKLNYVVIGEHVNNIGEFAFSDCTELANIYCYKESLPSAATNTFQASYINLASLHVPTSSINLYNSTLPWKDFGNIVALTDDDPKPTGINMVQGEGLKVNVYYDVQGRKVANPEKGIYIVNGKKLIVK